MKSSIVSRSLEPCKARQQPNENGKLWLVRKSVNGERDTVLFELAAKAPKTPAPHVHMWRLKENLTDEMFPNMVEKVVTDIEAAATAMHERKSPSYKNVTCECTDHGWDKNNRVRYIALLQTFANGKGEKTAGYWWEMQMVDVEGDIGDGEGSLRFRIMST
jgi:hypothetical protein